MVPGSSAWFGSVSLWQLSQSTPSASPARRPLPFVGVERPAYHPPVLWQRMQRSPEPAKSCSATATVAQKIGSRPALAIMLPRQLKAGSVAWL
jgi:hypothetical protein